MAENSLKEGFHTCGSFWFTNFTCWITKGRFIPPWWIFQSLICSKGIKRIYASTKTCKPIILCATGETWCRGCRRGNRNRTTVLLLYRPYLNNVTQCYLNISRCKAWTFTWIVSLVSRFPLIQWSHSSNKHSQHCATDTRLT